MPTLSADRVSVLPLSADTALSLEDILSLMKSQEPELSSFTGGWASTDNRGSMLRIAGVNPPKSAPRIIPKSGNLPKMILSRFYFWDTATAHEKKLPHYSDLNSRRLNALDLVLTKPSAGKLGILISTRTRAYLGKRDGAIKSLETIIQKREADFKVCRGESFLNLKDEEVFLWLTVQLRDNPQLSSSIRLDLIDGLFSRDVAQRSTDMKSSVDFDRPGFLTSVAEQDTLGPIDISFVEQNAHYNDSYRIKLHFDGGFEMKKSDLHLNDQLNRTNLMEDTSIDLAFSLIPQINQLYINDASDWATKRQLVIEEAMEILQERYKLLQARLAVSVP